MKTLGKRHIWKSSMAYLSHNNRHFGHNHQMVQFHFYQWLYKYKLHLVVVPSISIVVGQVSHTTYMQDLILLPLTYFSKTFVAHISDTIGEGTPGGVQCSPSSLVFRWMFPMFPITIFSCSPCHIIALFPCSLWTFTMFPVHSVDPVLSLNPTWSGNAFLERLHLLHIYTRLICAKWSHKKIMWVSLCLLFFQLSPYEHQTKAPSNKEVYQGWLFNS